MFHVNYGEVAAQRGKRSMTPVPAYALKSRYWRLDTIVDMQRRRWLLRPWAVEIFFVGGQNEVFLSLHSKDATSYCLLLP